MATIPDVIGKTVSLSDGTPQPPARCTKKLREWQRNNDTGRIVERGVQPATYPNGSPFPYAGWWHTTIAKGRGLFQGAITVEFRAIVLCSKDMTQTSDGRTVSFPSRIAGGDIAPLGGSHMATRRIVPPDPKLSPELLEGITQALGRDWQSTRDENNLSDYVRQERATLTYVGSDPLLQGASLTGWTCRGGAGQVNWSVRGHAGPQQGPLYIPDTLQGTERQQWVGAVNISAAKPPARIARELQTRLLDHYLPAYRHAMVRLAERHAAQAADAALAAELAALLGVQVRMHPWNGSEALQVWTNTPLGSCSVSNGQLHTAYQLHLNPQQARELCALVVTWKEER